MLGGGSEQFEVASYQPLNLSAGNLGGEAGPGKSLALPLVIPGVSHPQSMADDQEGSSPELEGIYPDGPFDLSTLMEPSLALVRSDGDEAQLSRRSQAKRLMFLRIDRDRRTVTMSWVTARQSVQGHRQIGNPSYEVILKGTWRAAG